MDGRYRMGRDVTHFVVGGCPERGVACLVHAPLALTMQVRCTYESFAHAPAAWQLRVSPIEGG